MKGKSEMLTARQFADRRQVPYTTVIFWLKNEALKGAEKLEIPFGRQGFVWRVPADAELPILKPGPKAKTGKGNKPAKKSRKKASKKG